ncbi:hypothetical protein P7K49_023276 [Saguinus oedipus]|uniref:Uncharacterized protein n=1 Tax=Saguinus oedipus TaxID=9490 RepID=A0ABQ9UM18_SAGOE|nr:hypothetical protein P7K49_023276 [Saguinus oedipus]
MQVTLHLHGEDFRLCQVGDPPADEPPKPPVNPHCPPDEVARTNQCLPANTPLKLGTDSPAPPKPLPPASVPGQQG